MQNTKKLENSNNYFVDTLWRLGENLVTVSWAGLGPLIQKILRSPLKMIAIFGVLYVAIYKLASNAIHLQLLAWAWPSLFSGRFLKWLYHFTGGTQANVIYVVLVYGYLLFLGARALIEKRQIREKFESIGLMNKFGQTPALIYRKPLDEFREFLVFNATSIGVDQFETKRDSVEAAFGKAVESIKRPSDLRNIEIVLTTKTMTNFVGLTDLMDQSPLKDGSFYVGESSQGIETAKIESLPHLLIAGTTGAGKSIFFKQAILGLLSSSSNLQVYFVDLKRGLEATDFKSAPNVAIAKDPDEALQFLERIHDEMERRFKFLEAKGLKSISPKRDRLDRIVVAVDEAAELYADRSKLDPDYETTINAQKLTNSIARLGRAAGIHLILATQKVTKESINTIIQENISMRICFKLNTLQGSLQVLGSKDAMDLPTIPGRAIYQFGNEQHQVQAPYVSDQDVRNICSMVALDFSDGKKSLSQEMIATHKAPSPLTLVQDSNRPKLLDTDA